MGILNECYQADKTLAHKLLVRNLKQWGDKTLFMLAENAKLMNFVQQTCTQTKLNIIWRGRMVLTTPYWKVCPLKIIIAC